jgi:hypothetical protein
MITFFTACCVAVAPLLEILDDLGLSCLVYDGECLRGGLEGNFSAMVVLERRAQDNLLCTFAFLTCNAKGFITVLRVVIV